MPRVATSVDIDMHFSEYVSHAFRVSYGKLEPSHNPHLYNTAQILGGLAHTQRLQNSERPWSSFHKKKLPGGQIDGATSAMT